MDYSTLKEKDFRHPPLDPNHPREAGWLKAADGHEIHWQEYGNPQGEPLLIIHGGPGGGISHGHAGIANPERYRIILFDQRGCGKSRPHVADDLAGAMKNNTTQATIDDIEALRAERGLAGRKLHIYGGSWGSTAAIAYAEQHPEHIESLNLRGIFLCDRDDLSFFYQGNAGAPGDLSIPGAYRAYLSDGAYTIPNHLRVPEMAAAYKEAWDAYAAIIPPEERGDMISAYHDRLNNPKYSQAEREGAALAWSHWEDVTSNLHYDLSKDTKFKDARFALAFATIENEYFFRSLHGQDPVLSDLMKPEKLARLKDIPTVTVVQGAHDQVCVPLSARKFRDGMEQHGGGLEAYVETTAGHALLEAPTYQAVASILDALPPMKKNWVASEGGKPPSSGPQIRGH